MRKTCLLTIAIALCLALAPARAERVVRLTSGEWPPYMSQTLPQYGVASRIVTEAFRLQGIAVQYGFFPWPRALALAKTGTWDGTLVWQKTDERMRDFDFSDQVVDSGSVLFYLKDKPFSWSTVADLAPYRIGITSGYFYGDAFSAAVKRGQLNVETVSSDEMNLRKLLYGRIQLFPCDRIVGLAMLAQKFTREEANRIAFAPNDLVSNPLRLMLSKHLPDGAALMAQFNLGLKKLQASGQLERFLHEAAAPRTDADK